YTLHEEQDGKRMDTTFEAKAGEGVQSVTFCCIAEMQFAEPRRYKFVFSNMLSGEATVFADGKTYPAAVDDNGRLSVTVEGIQCNTQYEISVRCKHQADRKRKEALQKTITKLQMDNNEKNIVYEKLLNADKETYLNIVEQMPVPRIAKDRLIEIR
ncbi:MAG: hypothetical protein K2O40_12070, partial [Lachnospiraceae bacterium]|nr:hypothetical protein [Lachnospiraceae bacterium]